MGLILTLVFVPFLQCVCSLVCWLNPCPSTTPPLPAERLGVLWTFWKTADSVWTVHVCICLCVCVCRNLAEEREVVCDSSDSRTGRFLFFQLRLHNTAEWLKPPDCMEPRNKLKKVFWPESDHLCPLITKFIPCHSSFHDLKLVDVDCLISWGGAPRGLTAAA